MSSPLKNVFLPPVRTQALQILPQVKGPRKQAKPRQKQSPKKPEPTPAAIPITTPTARSAATPPVGQDTADEEWENVSHCQLLEKDHQVWTAAGDAAKKRRS